MKAPLALAVALTCLILSPASRALVVYDADATSTFTLLDPGGLDITFTIGVEPTPTATTGTGVASVDADSHADAAGPLAPPVGFAPAVGDFVTITSEVSGSADAPGGASTATVFNGFTVSLENSGPGPASALFEFSYSWLVDLSKTVLARESGSASSFFALSGFAPSGTETLMIDDGSGGGLVPMASWLVHPEVLAPLGVAGATLADTETVLALVTVPGMTVDVFSVITDATGSAVHVPEPTSLALALLACAWLWAGQHVAREKARAGGTRRS